MGLEEAPLAPQCERMRIDRSRHSQYAVQMVYLMLEQFR